MLQYLTDWRYFHYFLDIHEVLQIKIQELQLHYMHLVHKKPFVRSLHKLV